MYTSRNPESQDWPFWWVMPLILFFGILIPALLAINNPPVAHADTVCFSNCLSDPGAQPWPGRLMPTWDTPGTYGGWTNDPVLCNPSTMKCEMVANP